jgi:predicted SAM-dependent methyltransferase
MSLQIPESVSHLPKVVLGCGPWPIDKYHMQFIDSTWTLTDLHPNIPEIQKVDARQLPYGSNSLGAIYASHILEHVMRPEIDKVLNEWQRVLYPGGIIQVSIPDMEWACKLIIDNPTSLEKFDHACDVIYNSQQDGIRDVHFFGFTEFTLRHYFGKYFKIQEVRKEFVSHHVPSIEIIGIK